jgi:hypothetical protein
MLAGVWLSDVVTCVVSFFSSLTEEPAMNRRYKVRAVFLTAFACTLSATWAHAQQGSGGGVRRSGGIFSGPSPMGLLTLVNNPEVQKELKLTNDQKAKLAQCIDQVMAIVREVMPKVQNADPAEREQMLAAMRQKTGKIEQKFTDGLSTEQNVRLQQIALQEKGAAALATPEVAKSLEITDDQKRRLRDVQSQAAAKRKTATAGLPSQDRVAKMEQLRKEELAAALAVLTAEQKAKFDKLRGAEVKFDPGASRSIQRSGIRRGGGSGG